jgi:1-deoxy-D-xylulose-5-phosphate reductoisomerase
MRSVTILGATGSIGRTTATIIAGQGERFRVEAVAGGSDAQALAAMAIRLGARFAAIADPAAHQRLRAALAGTGIDSGSGEGAVIEAAVREADMVVAGISGTAGLRPTHAAVLAGRTVALANKECLVCAGTAFMAAARKAGATVLPMDSEHNAIFQALGRHRVDEVERMVLTASGGPFRTWSAERIATARREEALAHPNYAMGTKVTVDSASMMNKGLELIEAHHLFGIDAGRLGVLVHPQQIVHGLVTFADGAMVAGMGMPDMSVPIAHCLGFPDRLSTSVRRVDLAAIGRLDFEPPDLARFPALRLAMAALAGGGTLPAVLNAANEVAVQAFLAGSLRFGAIPRLIEAVMDSMGEAGARSVPCDMEAALEVDGMARREARAQLETVSNLAH